MNHKKRKFGRWQVIGLGKKSHLWLCQCSCQKKTVRQVDKFALIRGRSKSCGCFRPQLVSNSRRQHGESVCGKVSAEYRAWSAMKIRCYRASGSDVKHYQKRVIKVCDRWLSSFQNFLDDMGRRPSPRHSIDRYPDRGGDYEPGNCRWATAKEQSRNRDGLHPITFNGETKLLCEWADFTGFSSAVISKRLAHGWSVEKALTTPINHSLGPKSHRK